MATGFKKSRQSSPSGIESLVSGFTLNRVRTNYGKNKLRCEPIYVLEGYAFEDYALDQEMGVSNTFL
ncbi:hypothetical protein GCM10007877_32590 [Marinibactrum halimedae]|uniref:Uncharacterized protein n=1 Tax=Marinibactrum halimedae TaxID=1444977 RepID=A0AA37T5T3_9GAMM|nr:hypothetical protein GCM10007877_32590 [Marinibactrum halimedae]